MSTRWAALAATCGMIVTATGLASPVQAQSSETPNLFTGHGFRTACPDSSAPNSDYSLSCLMLVSGVIEGWFVRESGMRQTICLPAGGNWGQYYNVVFTYVRQHPEQENLKTSELVALAMLNAFRCPPPPPHK